MEETMTRRIVNDSCCYIFVSINDTMGVVSRENLSQPVSVNNLNDGMCEFSSLSAEHIVNVSLKSLGGHSINTFYGEENVSIVSGEAADDIKRMNTL